MIPKRSHKFFTPCLSVSRTEDDFVLEFSGNHSGIVRFRLARPMDGCDPLGWHVSGNTSSFWPGSDPWSFAMMLSSMVVSSINNQSSGEIPNWKSKFLQKLVASKLVNLIRSTVPLMDCRLLPHLHLIQKHLKFYNWQVRNFTPSAAIALAYAIKRKDDIRLSLMLSQCVNYDSSEDGFMWGNESRSFRFRFHEDSPSDLVRSLIDDNPELLISAIRNSTRRTHPLSLSWMENHFKFDACELHQDDANMFILGATHDVYACKLCVKRDAKAYAEGVRMLLKTTGSPLKTTKLFSEYSCVNHCN